MRDGGGGGGAGFSCIFAARLLLSPLTLLVFAWLPAPARAQQVQPPAQSLLIHGAEASTWSAGGANVIQVEGPISIQMDRLTMTARRAVVWLEASPAGQAGEEKVTVALLGDAKAQRPEVTRSGDRLLVTARVNGPIRITAENRLARDLSNTETFRVAAALRQQIEGQAPPAPRPFVPGVGRPGAPATAPAPPAVAPPPAATTRPARVAAPVLFRAPDIRNITAADGKMALALAGGVALTRQEADGSVLEMQADRAVLFTTLERLRDLQDMQQVRVVEEAITAAYLEGDVRVILTPPTELSGEQRMQANRVYYDFTTDRAVLTDAVLHTVDVQRQIPIIVRAETIKQLSEGEHRAEGAELSTSSFAVPSYSVRADKAYVRQTKTADEERYTRTTFSARDVTLNAFGVPFFWLPRVGGTMTNRGTALREIQVGQSSNFGTSIETRWGLLETLGQVPPDELDISYRLDYFSDRGPAGGIDASYGGGAISGITKQALNFQGEFESYFVKDHGVDNLGRRRGEVDPEEELRGRASWAHQHFFPDHWQLQLRSSWVSDATFMEEWFEDDFDEQLPMETSLFLKRQQDTEAITFLATVQPNNVVTTADLLQEQFEVERLPEIGYHRIGDSWAGDRATFFSNNTVSRLKFNQSGTGLAEQGFRFGRDVRPGRPSLGLVGVSGLNGPPDVEENPTFRGDFRQELDFPFRAGQFKVVPYVFGRVTGYSDSPDGSNEQRGLAGAGVRVNTQFWKINDAARSELFDIHRTRHIIEPELHAWTSVSNTDPNELWIYDEHVDAIHDVSAVQIALRQRWQTKRGGPGRLRSVDFLTFDVSANFFANQPDDVELDPIGFRGLIYPSLPEASIPRNSINADSQWRVSDTTIVLADAAYNLDEQELATASIGIIARRDTRVSYLASLRYIEPLDSSIATLALSYELTRKYTIGLRQSYDFGDADNVYSSVTFQRRFDRFTMLLTVYNNSTDENRGISFGIFPEGFAGASTDALQRAFDGNR